jgi:hypothetical protein
MKCCASEVELRDLSLARDMTEEDRLCSMFFKWGTGHRLTIVFMTRTKSDKLLQNPE